MKIRTGFVSNSSSASFLINYKDLTEKQIQDFKDEVQNKRPFVEEIIAGEINTEYDRWTIFFFKDCITGSTYCDNEEIWKVFEKLNIPKGIISFAEEE